MFVDKILYKGEEYTRIHKGTELIAETPITMEESLTIVGATSISVVDNGTATHNIEYYDTSVGSWNVLMDSITPQGKVYLRGNIHTTSPTNFCQIKAENTTTNRVYIGGNLGSINGGHRVCTLDTKFISLFSGNSGIVIGNNTLAPNLILPYMSGIAGVYERLFMKTVFGSTYMQSDLLSTTGVAKGAFNSAFRETNIGKAPKLPVSRIIPSTCYANMFNKCSNLTDVSEIELSADEIGTEACLQMFYICTKLVQAPVLKIATLSDDCYSQMFNGCKKLNYIKCLATDISAFGCTANWVKGVSATGTFVKSANTSGWKTGRSGIPAGWTIENA